MKLVKSLLLGTAAGLAAVAGAQAADLPARKAAPVEYVRVCSTYGAGFFYIPGTEGCLRVGGQVRADYQWNETFYRGTDAVGFYARGRVQLDHRQATAYGLLRTFIRMEIARRSGAFGTTTSTVPNFSGAALTGAFTEPRMAQAYIQFGGLTAGRVTSFFDNPDLPSFHMIGLPFSDNPDVTVLAYTYSFGNGFSASISLEDPRERSVYRALPAAFFAAPGDEFASAIVPGGTRAPDIVGNVRYVGTWGNIQLSAAAHQIRDAGIATATTAGARTIGIAPNTFPQAYADSEWGFAVMLNGGINLDAIGPGDKLWFAATYADGALGYIGAAGGIGAGLVTTRGADGVVNLLTGDIQTTTAWSLVGGFQHNWTPQHRSGVFGGYISIDAPGVASSFYPATATFPGYFAGQIDGNLWTVGANHFWTPVSGLDIGVEVLYTRVNADRPVLVDVRGPANPGLGFRVEDDADIWTGRLRVQRTF